MPKLKFGFDIDVNYLCPTVAFFGLLALLGAALAAPAAASARGDLIQEGLERLKKGHFEKAEEIFERAADAEPGPCGECELGLAMVYGHTDEWRKGEKAARQAIELLDGHPQQHLAHLELGKICLQRAKKRESYLDCAEGAFRAAWDAGGSADSHFYLGATLLKKSEDREGLEVLKSFVETYPDHRDVKLARSYIDNPLRARKDLIPDFEWRTLRGKSLSSEELAGKVLLLDFWATWCKPCVNAVPTLRDIAEEHEDAPFQLISLSVDSSEGLIRDFIRDHSLTWPQVWDRERWGAEMLRINRYPTYLIVGPDGEILGRYSGGGGGVERRLERDVARAVRDAERAAGG